MSAPIHPDAIQFWTTNTTVAATDITITGNTFDRGSGVIVQGIFIQDEVGTLPYQRLTIADNVIVGAAYNGIAVRGAVDATLTNNTVIGEEDQTSWISLVQCRGGHAFGQCRHQAGASSTRRSPARATSRPHR